MISVFYFDRIPLVIGVAPKTGATTTLRFLYELQQTGTSREPIDIFESHDQEQISNHLFDNVGQFRLSADAAVPSDVAKVAILRNPTERIASSWIDKILAWPALSYQFFDEPWFPDRIFSSSDLESKYKEFLRALNDDVRCRNAHWDPVVPQYGGVQFDKWVRTDDLALFCQVLVELGVLPTQWKGVLLPSLNRSSKLLLNFLVRGTQSWRLPSRYETDSRLWHALQPSAIAESPTLEYQRNALSENELLRAVNRVRVKQLKQSGLAMARFHALQIERNELLTQLDSLISENSSLSQSLLQYRESRLATRSVGLRRRLPIFVRRFF